jgi:hypothetical protein
MQQLTSYDYYIEYLKVKCHFTVEKFNYYNYPKLNIKPDTFKARRDFRLFITAKERYSLEQWIDILVANFRYGYNVWVGDALSIEALQRYKLMNNIKQSLTYNITSDLQYLGTKYTLVELLRNRDCPALLKEFLQGNIYIETITVINLVTDWLNHITLKELYYNTIKQRIIKYGYFLHIDKNKYLNLILKNIKYKE